MSEPSLFLIKDSDTGEEYTFSLKSGRLSLVPASGGGDEGEAILVSMNWPSVSLLSNGQSVDANTFNAPISALSERTSYLFNKLRLFNRDNPLATVMMTDVPVDQSENPAVGDVMYLDAESMTFKKACATFSLFDDFTANDSSFAVGVLVKKQSGSGSIVIFGRLDMTIDGLSINNMLESGESFRPGRYYLSANEAGKITAYPTGTHVYIGTFTGGDYALLNVQSKNLGEAHVHRSYSIVGLPAGDQELTEDGPDGIHIYKGFSADVPAESDDVVPGLMFTGDWLFDGEIAYRFELQSYIGSLPPAETFGSDPGVFLKWSREYPEHAEGRVEFTAFDDPKEIEFGMYVSLIRGDTNSDIVYKAGASGDSVDKRSWSSMEFPKIGRGWRKLTNSEIEKYNTVHRGVGKEPKFVYNIGFDRSMQSYYPPRPIKSASLVMNGVELTSDVVSENYVYTVEPDSIYWYDNTFDHVPWPTYYKNRFQPPEEWEARNIIIHFIRTATTDTGPVLSLQGAPGSGVRVYGCGSTDPASTGDLVIDIDPIGDVVEDSLPGYKVVKAGSGGKFKTGPVVERVLAGAGIRVTHLGDSPAGQGTVVVSAVSSGIQGDFEEVALQNAKQDMVGMFPYIRLLSWSNAAQNNTPSAFILKFHVPYDNPNGLYRVQISANVFGTQDYVYSALRYAGLKVDYSILPDLNPVKDDDSGTYESANIQDDLISPDSSRVVEIPIVSNIEDSVFSYIAFDPLYVHTEDGEEDIPGKKYAALGDPIPSAEECKKYMERKAITTIGVKPGHTVAVRISRGPVVSGAAEYTAPIGFMNMQWALERVE